MSFDFAPDFTLDGEVLELDPPRRFASAGARTCCASSSRRRAAARGSYIVHLLHDEGEPAAAGRPPAGTCASTRWSAASPAKQPGPAPAGVSPEWRERYDEYVAAGMPAGAEVPAAGDSGSQSHARARPPAAAACMVRATAIKRSREEARPWAGDAEASQGDEREGGRNMRVTRAVGVGIALAALAAGPARAATSELSVTQRLQDRREVAAGTRAQVLGFEDGRFYANGWHTTGEMGGIITPPLKLLDASTSVSTTSGWDRRRASRAAGATSATSCRRSTASARADRLRARRPSRRAARPQADQPGGPQARQRDGRRALRAHDAVPVGLRRARPERERERRRQRIVRRRQARVPRHREAHGRDRQPLLHGDRRLQPRAAWTARTGPGYYGPFGPGRRCAGDQTPAPMPSECDDGPFGHGTGGRLRYRVASRRSGSTTMWIAVAGSENSRAEARERARRG